MEKKSNLNRKNPKAFVIYLLDDTVKGHLIFLNVLKKKPTRKVCEAVWEAERRLLCRLCVFKLQLVNLL